MLPRPALHANLNVKPVLLERDQRTAVVGIAGVEIVLANIFLPAESARTASIGRIASPPNSANSQTSCRRRARTPYVYPVLLKNDIKIGGEPAMACAKEQAVRRVGVVRMCFFRIKMIRQVKAADG